MTNNDVPRVTYLGHATVLFQMDHVALITDPVLRDQFLALRRHGRSVEASGSDLETVDVILLSHMHYDHADPPSLRRLPADALLVAPRGAGIYLRSRVMQEVAELSVGESTCFRGLRITATPAAHPSGRPFHSLSSPAVGYIVEGSHTVYFAGDTDLFDEMEDIGRDYKLDLALLPVAGYSPHVPTGHLNPRSAARALTMLRPRMVIPIHWGAFRPLGPIWKRLAYLQDPPFTFMGYASHLASGCQVRILMPGESTSFSARS